MPQIIAEETTHGDTIEHLKRYIYFYEAGLRDVKLRIIYPYIDQVKDLSVLDIGCSCGVFSSFCLKRGAKVYAIDLSKVMVKYVHTTIRELSVIQASGQNIPFPTGTFDIALALDVIEHVPKPLQLLREVHRVLKKDGILLLITPNRQFFITQRILGYYNLAIRKCFPNVPREPKKGVPCTHLKIYSTDEILNALETVGFEIVKYDTFSEAPFFQFVNLPFALIFRGSMRKWKWNKVFVICTKT